MGVEDSDGDYALFRGGYCGDADFCDRRCGRGGARESRFDGVDGAGVCDSAGRRNYSRRVDRRYAAGFAEGLEICGDGVRRARRSFSVLHRPIERHMDGAIVILDAAGLSLFAIVGTRKALVFGLHPLVAVLLGTISGVGGGTIRDVLLAQVPTVLRVGCVRDGGAGGRDRDGGDVSSGSAARVGGRGRRVDLFLFARGERVGGIGICRGCLGRIATKNPEGATRTASLATRSSSRLRFGKIKSGRCQPSWAAAKALRLTSTFLLLTARQQERAQRAQAAVSRRRLATTRQGETCVTGLAGRGGFSSISRAKFRMGRDVMRKESLLVLGGLCDGRHGCDRNVGG